LAKICDCAQVEGNSEKPVKISVIISVVSSCLCFFEDVSVFHKRCFSSEMKDKRSPRTFSWYFQICCLFWYRCAHWFLRFVIQNTCYCKLFSREPPAWTQLCHFISFLVFNLL